MFLDDGGDGAQFFYIQHRSRRIVGLENKIARVFFVTAFFIASKSGRNPPLAGQGTATTVAPEVRIVAS